MPLEILRQPSLSRITRAKVKVCTQQLERLELSLPPIQIYLLASRPNQPDGLRRVTEALLSVEKYIDETIDDTTVLQYVKNSHRMTKDLGFDINAILSWLRKKMLVPNEFFFPREVTLAIETVITAVKEAFGPLSFENVVIVKPLPDHLQKRSGIGKVAFGVPFLREVIAPNTKAKFPPNAEKQIEFTPIKTIASRYGTDHLDSNHHTVSQWTVRDGFPVLQIVIIDRSTYHGSSFEIPLSLSVEHLLQNGGQLLDLYERLLVPFLNPILLRPYPSDEAITQRFEEALINAKFNDVSTRDTAFNTIVAEVGLENSSAATSFTEVLTKSTFLATHDQTAAAVWNAFPEDFPLSKAEISSALWTFFVSIRKVMSTLLKSPPPITSRFVYKEQINPVPFPFSPPDMDIFKERFRRPSDPGESSHTFTFLGAEVTTKMAYSTTAPPKLSDNVGVVDDFKPLLPEKPSAEGTTKHLIEFFDETRLVTMQYGASSETLFPPDEMPHVITLSFGTTSVSKGYSNEEFTSEKFHSLLFSQLADLYNKAKTIHSITLSVDDTSHIEWHYSKEQF